MAKIFQNCRNWKHVTNILKFVQSDKQQEQKKIVTQYLK
jgi:hypothetical protein